MSVLLALLGRRRCPQSKCRSMYMAALLDTSTQTGRCRTLPGLAISKINKQPRPVVLSPTIIRLKDLRIRPTACLRSFRLRWWSGWHRSVLRGFAGWGVVLLALLGKPPCPLSRCQRMDIIILSVAQAATVDMQAVHPCSGKIPPPQTPVMLAGGRPIPTR